MRSCVCKRRALIAVKCPRFNCGQLLGEVVEFKSRKAKCYCFCSQIFVPYESTFPSFPSPLAKQKYILSLSTKKIRKVRSKGLKWQKLTGQPTTDCRTRVRRGCPATKIPGQILHRFENFPFHFPRSGGLTTRGCLKSSLMGQAIRPVACLKSSWPIWIPYLKSRWSSGLSL
jgi:hypothetical protein